MSTAVTINGAKISTTVAKRSKEVDDSIEMFLSRKNYVIGLDIELSLSRDSEGVPRSKIAILTLCDWDHCLIVQLPLLDSVPTSLFNFLQLADYTFVGFNIARSMARLEKEYGFGCKNFADLRTIAANKNPHAAMWGSLKMAEKFWTFDWYVEVHCYKPESAVFDDWGDTSLKENQIKHTTMNVYAYLVVGTSLGDFGLVRNRRSWDSDDD